MCVRYVDEREWAIEMRMQFNLHLQHISSAMRQQQSAHMHVYK